MDMSIILELIMMLIAVDDYSDICKYLMKKKEQYVSKAKV